MFRSRTSLSKFSKNRNGQSLQQTQLQPPSPSETNSETVNPQRQPEQKYVLIDTDAGTDDAWALFMALMAHKDESVPFEIIGITTVCGNTAVDNVTNNVTRTLDTVNEPNIPIYRGMANPMISEFRHLEEPPWHGEDGFGDANLPQIPTRIEAETAVDAIIRFSQEYQGQLTVICLGPLTNLAMAVKIKPEIRNLIKEIFILGGTVEAQGNLTMTSEYNFGVDPESVRVVLGDFAPCPITILPWETCLFYATSTHDFRTSTLGTMNSPQINLLNQIEAKILGYNPDTWLAPDPVLIACIIDPNVIKARQAYYCDVELQGSLTRGMLVVDRGLVQDKPPNATFILDVDLSLYEFMLVWTAGGPRQ